jgi:cardiolipin synthase A/B
MRAVEDDYRSKSRQVLLEDWVGRPRRDQVLDNLMRLTSALQ